MLLNGQNYKNVCLIGATDPEWTGKSLQNSFIFCMLHETLWIPYTVAHAESISSGWSKFGRLYVHIDNGLKRFLRFSVDRPYSGRLYSLSYIFIISYNYHSTTIFQTEKVSSISASSIYLCLYKHLQNSVAINELGISIKILTLSV
jgi:hypothetical protein